MRNLFDAVPPSLFAPLAAPSRRVYAATLLRLYDLAQGAFVIADAAALEAVLDVVAAADPDDDAALAEDILAELAVLEPDPPAEEPDALYRRQRATARAILRRLEATGWLTREVQRDFSVQYTLPEYAFPLLEGFRAVLDRRPAEFEGMIYNTYLLLHRPDARVPGYVLLQQAYDQTRRIVAGLKQLQHNIGTYLEQVAGRLDVPQVLQHFAAYRAEVAPNYHRLKTADHVARYRLDIQQALARYLTDATWIEAAVEEAGRRRQERTPAEARATILDQLGYVARQFDQMDEVMALIDERHSRYAEATVAQIQYRLGDGQTDTARLAALARQLGALPGSATGPAPAPLPPLFHLFEVDHLSPHSLYTPPQARASYEPPALVVPPLDPAVLRDLRAELDAELARQITPARAWAYLAPALAARPVVATTDLPLDTLEQWLLLIGLRVYADLPDSPYLLLAPPPEQPWLERDGFRCPNLRFARAGAEAA